MKWLGPCGSRNSALLGKAIAILPFLYSTGAGGGSGRADQFACGSAGALPCAGRGAPLAGKFGRPGVLSLPDGRLELGVAGLGVAGVGGARGGSHRVGVGVGTAGVGKLGVVWGVTGG